jgi:hypothetical protein
VEVVLQLQATDLCSMTFLSFSSSFFRRMCASVMPLGHCVVAKATCNWYLCDINICSLLKNNCP